MEMAEVAFEKQSLFTHELVQELQVFPLEKLPEEMVSQNSIILQEFMNHHLESYVMMETQMTLIHVQIREQQEMDGTDPAKQMVNYLLELVFEETLIEFQMNLEMTESILIIKDAKVIVLEL